MEPALEPALSAWSRALGAGVAPDDLPPCPGEGFVDALERHGVAAASAQLFHGSVGWSRLDPAVAARLRGAARDLAARELAWSAPLAGACTALAAAKVRVLVIKGEALARTLYAKAGMRERCDVDLWVHPRDFARASETLVDAGFAAQTSATGFWSLPERMFTGPAGLTLDLHQSLFSQPLLARVLEFDAVWMGSTDLPGLAARAPAQPHALLIAVLHRLAHHTGDAGRLIWLYDVDLMVRSAPTVLELASRQALAAGVAGLLAEALAASRAAFGTPLPNPLLEQLASRAPFERATRLLAPMSPLARRWFDFSGLPGMRARLAWLRELVLPDAAYMRERYGGGGLAYVRRAVAGIAKVVGGR